MKKVNILFIICVALFWGQTIQAQGVGVNEDNSSPNASAMLDVKSTTKGMLIPRMQTGERTTIPAPATSLLVFDTDTNSFWFFNGTIWVELRSGTDNDNQDLTLAGNTLSLTNDVTTVDLSGYLDNTDNQNLSYNATTGVLTIQNGNSVNLATGDILEVIAGTGLTGGGTTGSITVNAVGDNGLTTNADDIDLGGALNQPTTITQGANNMTFNLDGTGDFLIQDNGVSKFTVRDDGTSRFGGNVQWRTPSVNGGAIAELLEDAGSGRFRVYEGGNTTVDLDANTGFIFNEQGLDRDFRV
ncbi:MAG: hypothetical protein GY810_23300, partial [Aureispira sp.]|nr:hypothetical protein [Aureispira sp.]